MRNFRGISMICLLFMFLSFVLAHSCAPGEISAMEKCISCSWIKNTEPTNTLLDEECPCLTGFTWSSLLHTCLPQNYQQPIADPIDPLPHRQYFSESRLLATSTCDKTNGFILYQQTNLNKSAPALCTNCRLLPYSYSVQLNSSACTCYPSFKFIVTSSTFNNCYCYSPKYIDPYTSTCAPCASISPSLLSACSQCAFPFTYSIFGCVYSLNLTNAGSLSTSTACATGFTFSFYSSSCVCSYSGSYSIYTNGICTKCATGDSNCRYCQKTYVYDGFQCKHGSLIPNYNITSFACSPGTTFKFHFFTNAIIACACSSAAQYYQNGASCIACNVNLPSGVALIDCQSCSASAGFYLGSVECIYCPGVANSKGTASINGCDCTANYFWNMTSGQCECDFVMGYIPANSTCIACNNIDNTDYLILPNACTCTKGYKWNPNTYNCDCDTSQNLAFLLGGACVDCSTMKGSVGNVGIDGISCECLSSFYWNQGLGKCMCDSNQNFAVFSNGLCTDCMAATYANGLGNSFGCVCTNGLSWDSNVSKCMCPAGSVMIGTTCITCASAGLPSGATVADCTACLNSKGFVNQSLGCYACSSQYGASSTVTNGNCTCITQTQVWRPLIGGCGCDWGAKYVGRMGTNSSSLKCSLCSWKWNDGSCACSVWFLIFDSTNQFCIDASYDPHGSGSSTTFSCNTGYMWSQSVFPYQCVPGYSSGSGYFSSSNTSYIACSLASNPTACAMCDFNSGYLFVSGTKICVLCSTVTKSTGVAVLNGCLCSAGSQWNPSTFTCDTIACATGTIYNHVSKTCVCDPVRSIKINSGCISCNSISQSNGFANTTTSCGCNPLFAWFSQINGGGCFNPNSICNSTTQISYAGGCFNCPSSFGPGLANGSICQCNANYAWKTSTNGGSCVCDLTKAYTFNSNCLLCPSIAQDPNSLGKGDGNGGCMCLATYVWIASSSSGSCSSCSSMTGMVMLSNGSCFSCGTNGTYTTFKLVSTLNNSCSCSILTLQWNSDGYCDCGPGSAMVPSNSSFSCFVCSNTSAFTTTKATSFSCNCIGNLIWKPINKNCGCENGSFLIGSGPTAACFSCQITNSIGVFNGSSCQCAANFIWKASVSGGSCVCDFSKSYLIGANCLPCPTFDQDPNSAGTGNGNGSCLCLGNSSWTVKNSSGSCIRCNSYSGIVVLSNSSCLLCGTGGTFTKAKIVTTLNNTCTCSLSILSWNSNGYCDCGDGKVMVPQGRSYACYSCNNINGYTIDKTSSFNCSCVSNTMIWVPIKRDCRCTTKSILKGSGYAAFCYDCPTINGKGIAKGSSCVCNTNYVWVSTTTGGRCDCNLAKSYLVGSSCLPCPTSSQDSRSTGTGDGNGGCVCTGNYVWVASKASCMLCTTPGSIQLSNGTCLVCGAPESNTLAQFATSQNNSCSCVEGFVWNPLGLCDCGSTAILTTSAGSPSCFSCANTSAFTSSKADPYSCTCVSQTMKWNANTKTCICPSNSILVGSGALAYCFVCPVTGNFLGISADRSSCICAGSLVWNNGNLNCGCLNSQNVVIGSGYESQCVSCSSILYASTFVNSTTCSCLGNGLVFNSSGAGSCKCPLNNIISSTFTCIVCPNGSVPLTPYECRCPFGSIWSYSAQKCLQCGSALLPNSLSADGTSLACVCSASYIWDVMTQSCILSSTCIGASSSCMTCPSGSALAANPSTVRNLRLGNIIFGFLSGSFTNYNQISSYQCPCSTGYLWDSIRLRCFASGLQ